MFSDLCISWKGVKGPNPTLLVKLGQELHAVQLSHLPHMPHMPVGDDGSRYELSRGLANIVADMFPDEGLLLLSASTGQYLSSTPEAVLVLDVDRPTAAQLNSM
jgi:hypothetical protein